MRPAIFRPRPGERDDADDDACGRGRGGDTEHAGRRRPRSAAKRRRGVSAVSRRQKLSAKASSVAQNTARNADMPERHQQRRSPRAT